MRVQSSGRADNRYASVRHPTGVLCKDEENAAEGHKKTAERAPPAPRVSYVRTLTMKQSDIRKSTHEEETT